MLAEIIPARPHFSSIGGEVERNSIQLGNNTNSLRKRTIYRYASQPSSSSADHSAIPREVKETSQTSRFNEILMRHGHDCLAYNKFDRAHCDFKFAPSLWEQCSSNTARLAEIGRYGA